MGTHSLKTHTTMVATQVLISLCVAGLAGAAPQQLIRAAPATSASGVSQQGLVTNVVASLQPSIAAAVAEALRGLGSSGASSGSTRTSATYSTGSSATGSLSTSQQGASASGVSIGASSASPVDAATGRAVYSYQYQIADDLEQTYITQNEARDGDEVTGTYSYVDANGDLVTVNYQAGPTGYTQTLEKQVGAVEVRARPVRPATSVVENTSAVAVAPTRSVNTNQFGVRRTTGGSTTSTTSSSTSSNSNSQSFSDSDLIGQILSVLQPQISAAVNTAIASQ